MSNDFRISYSGFKLYDSCPLAYKFRYILKERGVFDPKNTMYGSIIGKLFEWFYQDSIWKHPDPAQVLLSRAEEAIDEVFLNEGYTKRSDPSYESQIREDLKKYVPLGVNIIREHKFLTPRSAAEVDLTTNYKPESSDITIRLVGRADFIHYPESGPLILDGKASKHREKYVDKRQLIWYATQHYLKYHVAPVQIGFLFWSFPDNPLSYVAYTSDDMRNCLSTVVDTAKSVISGEFEAKPSGQCHRCDYYSKCSSGQEYTAKRRSETSPKVQDSLFDVESI